MSEPASHQRDSDAAPSSAPADPAIRLSLSADERAGLELEVARLQSVAVIGSVIGSRPSRGELRDLLQGRLRAEVSKIVDIQTLGRGFYQVEFATPEDASKVLALSPLDIRSARAFFRPWTHGFEPSVAAREPRQRQHTGFPVTVCFPGLPREYLPLLPQLGATLGIPLESPRTAASVVARAAGIPSVRVIVPDPATVPSLVELPTLSGGWIEQRVEYSGLPDQCFICRQRGHLAKACPRRRTRPTQPQQQQQPQTASAPPPQDPPRGMDGGGVGSTSSSAPDSEGWQQVGGGRRRGSAAHQAPPPPPPPVTQHWVPTGNRFSALREDPPPLRLCLGPPGPASPSSGTCRCLATAIPSASDFAPSFVCFAFRPACFSYSRFLIRGCACGASILAPRPPH